MNKKNANKDEGSGGERIPDVVRNPTGSDYLEVMSRAVFQAGLSWGAIAKRWAEYRAAFDGFEPEIVARYGEADIERLMGADGVLHSRRKIAATIENAKALLEVIERFGSVGAYVKGFESYEALAKDVRKRFKFMGEMNVWYWLFRVGEPVPRFEHWVRTIPGEHPRMQEMVEKARSAGISTEY